MAAEDLVVQWIGHIPAKDEMQVRFLPRSPVEKQPPLSGRLFFCGQRVYTYAVKGYVSNIE